MIRLLLRAAIPLTLGFYLGISLERWAGTDLNNKADEVSIAAEKWVADLALNTVDWVKNKIDSP